jgi:hypothetical protein
MNTEYEHLMSLSQVYWILDGENKAYHLREEIKAWGGYWVPEHKAWCIDNPGEAEMSVFKRLGLMLQFRRMKA